MKKQFLSAKTLMLTALVLVVSGCAITIKHTFDQPPVVVNNYYQGGGGSGNPEFVNTLSTEGLGVGYDVVWTDPEDWTKNSVQGVGVRPRVFEFLSNPDPKDPNATIEIPKLNRDAILRRKPLGVKAETNAVFKWDENLVYVQSTSDFQTANETSVSAGGGFAGVAFSASASFGNVQQKTAAEGKTVASKNGAFRGLKMEIDFNQPQKFTPEFIGAVQKLDNNPATYSAFINNWGTHFSKVATIGAKCAYTLQFSNSDVGTRFKDNIAFKGSVSGSVAGVSAEVSAGYTAEKQEELKKSTGAESISFVSYGGSGKGINDFSGWTNDAVDNPTMIDAYLIPYDTLFSKEFFPKDILIDQKKRLFKEALEKYKMEAQKKVNALPKAKGPDYSIKPQAQTFKVTATHLLVVKGFKETFDERYYGSVTDIGVYNERGETLSRMFVFNLNGDWPNNVIKLKRGDKPKFENDEKYPHFIKREFDITLQPDQLAGAFVTIDGWMKQRNQWGNLLAMGEKYHDKAEDEEKIPLSGFDLNLNKTKKKFVTFKHVDIMNEGDVVEIHFEVTRIK